MRKAVSILALCVLCQSAFGIMIFRDTSELGVSGMVDFNSANGTLIDLTTLYGYFWEDYIEIGGKVNIMDDDSNSLWSIGGFGEYDFDLGMELVPFVSAGLSIAQGKSDTADENNIALVLDVQGGAKYFISDNTALSAALIQDIASNDVFPGDNELQSLKTKIELGLRFFF